MASMVATHDDEKIRKACFMGREALATDLLPEYIESVRLYCSSRVSEYRGTSRAGRQESPGVFAEGHACDHCRVLYSVSQRQE